MTELNQTALASAKCALNAIEGTTVSKPAIELLIERAITAYLAVRREQGWVEAPISPSSEQVDVARAMLRSNLRYEEIYRHMMIVLAPEHSPVIGAKPLPSRAEIVTAAIAAEREACALIAETVRLAHPEPAFNRGYNDAADSIAAAIRSRSSISTKGENT